MTLVQRTTESGTAWVNASGLEISDQLDGTIDRLQRQLSSWVDRTQGRTRSHLFDRSAYVAPNDPYSTIRVAREAARNDDIVGTVLDVAEGLMFHQGFKWEADDPDDADVFNQLARDLDLDSQLRTWMRSEFTDAQVVVGLWWANRSYRVRGSGKGGRARRKDYDIAAPVAMTFLDSLRVVPLPPGPFGQDRLAWHATRGEYADYTAMVDGAAAFDPLMREFFNGPVTGLSREISAQLTSWSIDPNRLIWLNPRTVFRHTLTKSPWEPFPDNRLRRTFIHLDLKQQLLEAERVSLVGAANYLLLVKKGSKDDPASQEELDNLNEGMKTLAKLPVIVGDHRLDIEIITPAQDHVLNADKHRVLDERILSATLMSLAATGGTGQRDHGALTSGTAVARTLQSRRHMMRRAIERELARAIVEHPYNVGKFGTAPSLAFIQRNIQTVSDTEFATQVMALRTQKEISRESTLDYFGFDQATEAQRRELEEEVYDDIFKTQVPFAAADGTPPSATGTQGGRPDGGGDAAESPQARTRPRSKNGTGSNPSTGGPR